MTALALAGNACFGPVLVHGDSTDLQDTKDGCIGTMLSTSIVAINQLHMPTYVKPFLLMLGTFHASLAVSFPFAIMSYRVPASLLMTLVQRTSPPLPKDPSNNKLNSTELQVHRLLHSAWSKRQELNVH